MAGAVKGAQARLIAQLDAQGQRLHRLGAELAGGQGVAKMVEAIVQGQRLIVGEGNGAFGPRRDGEDAGAEEAATHIFQQGRVLAAADDLFVDAARFLGVQHLPFPHLAIHPHLKIADAGIRGQGEEIDALHLPGSLVAEDLFDLHRGDGPIDHRVDAVQLDADRPAGRDGRAGGRRLWIDALGQGSGGREQQDQGQRPQTNERFHRRFLLAKRSGMGAWAGSGPHAGWVRDPERQLINAA